jgi:hypothetical protein
MRIVVWLLILVLLIVHQDNWLWDDGALIFGFVPIGLMYHAGISLAAGVCWFLATLFCWPADLEEVESAEEGASHA